MAELFILVLGALINVNNNGDARAILRVERASQIFYRAGCLSGWGREKFAR